jgi:hypothetical protein
MNTADHDHQFDTAIAALHAILTTLRDQARENATLRAHLVTLGQALCTLAEPPMDETPRTAEPQTTSAATDSPAPPAPMTPVPAAPTAGTPPDTAATTPEPQPLASREDIERLRRHWNGTGEEPVPVTPSLLPAPPAAEPLADEQDLLYALSTCCAHHAAVIQHLRNQNHALTTPLPTCDPDAAAIVGDDGNRWVRVMQSRSTITPEAWDALAGSYTATATITETLAQVLDDAALAAYRITGLELAAEVQSALRAAVAPTQQPPDAGQEVFFQWIRRRAEQEEVFIRHYMRKRDRAEPEDWATRLERVETWRDQVEDAVYRHRHERKRMGKLRYQLHRVADGVSDEWPRALATIDALIEHGMPPSHRGLRHLLLPHLAALPAEPDRPRNVNLVVREIQRAHAATDHAPPDDDTPPPAESHITDVADLLRDTTIVLIGGDSRPRVAQTIEETFELRELIWCDTRPHQSYLTLEPAIARPDVVLVVPAIRWASHDLGAVRTLCEQYNTPLVRLPGGYNVAQLAHQVLQQASTRLMAMRAESDYG